MLDAISSTRLGKRQTDKSDQHHQCRSSSCEHAQKQRMPDKQATDCPYYRDKQGQKTQATSLLYESCHNIKDGHAQKLTEEGLWIGYDSYQQVQSDISNACTQKDPYGNKQCTREDEEANNG